MCKCGHCKAALKFLGCHEGTDLCTGTPGYVGQMVSLARAKVAAMNGNTMLMTLATGTCIARFMLPSIQLTPGGSAGKYSEGVDPNMGVALATALAGLAVI